MKKGCLIGLVVAGFLVLVVIGSNLLGNKSL